MKTCVRCNASFDGPLSRCKPCRGIGSAPAPAPPVIGRVGPGYSTVPPSPAPAPAGPTIASLSADIASLAKQMDAMRAALRFLVEAGGGRPAPEASPRALPWSAEDPAARNLAGESTRRVELD